MSIHAEARNNYGILEFFNDCLHVRKVFLQKRHRNSFTWILTNSLSSEFPMTTSTKICQRWWCSFQPIKAPPMMVKDDEKWCNDAINTYFYLCCKHNVQK